MNQMISQWIKKKVQAGIYSGAIALVYKEGQLFTAVEGKMGSECEEPLLRDALFSLESISKAVCSAPLVLLLSEEKVMGLDQPIGTWLPEFRDSGKDLITPRQILSHSSGLPDTDDVTLDLSLPPETLWKIALNLNPLFSPGSKVRYSDLAYLILGKAIEVAAGMKLDRLAKERLWLPLGMKNTYFNPPNSLIKKCTSNRGVRGKCVDPLDQALGGIVGCDGVFSTAEDLLIFSKMILNRTFFKAESFAAWTGEQAAGADQIGSDFEYLYSARKALGWELPGDYSHGGSLFSEKAFGKVGGTGTFLWIDPTKDLAAIYLTNYGQPVPFSTDNWSKLIRETGAKDFFDFAITC